MALNIMLQGTMSNAGKSLLSAGLCRIFRQNGYRVAPFKSQNMALNSFITKDGGEMGRAQVVQAEACGLEPDVRMNPILLKPTTDVGSQVIVNGQVRGNMRAMEYYAKKREFLPDVMRAYESLALENDVIVIEGAGSPAEINLKQDDFVNMGLAKLVDAPVLLIGDIDRGGVFAQLFGTIALLEPDERAHAAEHGGHADAAADEHRSAAECADVKAVAERAEHIKLVAGPALAEPLRALALHLKDDAQLGRLPCTDRDRAAQQMTLAAGNVNELTALRQLRDLRCVQHHQK